LCVYVYATHTHSHTHTHTQDDSDDSGAAETTFYEFQEVIARIADALNPDRTATLVEKLRLIEENLFGDVPQ
jgi:hypothetical protein